jgi:hypothetical protein
LCPADAFIKEGNLLQMRHGIGRGIPQTFIDACAEILKTQARGRYRE